MRYTLLILSYLVSFNLLAQTIPQTNKEANRALAVYGGALIGPIVSLNYEYTFDHSFIGSNRLLYTRIGVGYMHFWGEYVFIAGQLGMLTAADKNHHLDLAIGPLTTFPYDGIIPITATIAYRFQKPNGKTFFRIGGGLVEGFQVSGGIRF